MTLPPSLQRLNAAWAARAMREQLLMLLAVAALVGLGMDTVWWRPSAADRNRLVDDIARLQGEHDALTRQAEAAARQAVLGAAQERAMRERLDAARQRRLALRSAITPPAAMLQRLRDASGQGSRVTLLALSAAPAEKVDGGGAALAAASAASAAPADLHHLYRLPVEVTVQGDYGALVDYLARLERDAPALRWRQLDLETQAWPRLRLTLRAFTLAEQGHWAF